MQTQNLGNNEAITIGVADNGDGTYTALTHSSSKTFKTYNGAVKWMAKRGYNADGSRG